MMNQLKIVKGSQEIKVSKKGQNGKIESCAGFPAPTSFKLQITGFLTANIPGSDSSKHSPRIILPILSVNNFNFIIWILLN